MNLKEKAKAIKIYLPALFIAMKKRETPLPAKIFAGITIGYSLSPIDIIPDFIPVLGYLDDLIVLPLLATLSIKMIPQDIMETSIKEAAVLWTDGKPKKWYYGIPIMILWIAISALMLMKILN
ncbi:MAG: YkvA family protein [Dehalobacterium sp.]